MSKDQKTALLEGIEEACQRLDLAQADVDNARNIRDRVIMEALAAGVRQVDVAKAAGMTRDGVYKLALRHGGV